MCVDPPSPLPSGKGETWRVALLPLCIDISVANECAEMCNGSEEASFVRPIDFCITFGLRVNQ